MFLIAHYTNSKSDIDLRSRPATSMLKAYRPQFLESLEASSVEPKPEQ